MYACTRASVIETSLVQRMFQTSIFWFQVLNIFIILEIRKHNARMTSSGPGSRLRNIDLQLTVMLLLVTFSLLALTAPQYLRYLYYMIQDHPEQSPQTYAGYIGFVHISNKLSFCNSSVNFFLYCFGGSKFRRETWSILTCRYRCNGHRRVRSSGIGLPGSLPIQGQFQGPLTMLTTLRYGSKSLRRCSVHPDSSTID